MEGKSEEILQFGSLIAKAPTWSPLISFMYSRHLMYQKTVTAYKNDDAGKILSGVRLDVILIQNF